MAQNVTEVFRVTVPSVGLVLKARADIGGKQEAFARRIREDSPGDETKLLTDYSANVDCLFNFAGGDEMKTYSGWIFGDEKGREWTQSIYRKKSRFQNPMRQNYKHICALAANLGIDK